MKWITLGVGGALVATLAACGTAVESAHPPKNDKVTAAPDASAPDDGGGDIINVGLGGKAKWADGTTAELSNFSWHTTYANDTPASVSYVRFSVTIHAGNGEVIDLDSTVVQCPKGEGEVFTDDLPKNDTGHILSGDTRTETIGCAASTGKPIQIEITPANTDEIDGEWYRPAVFTGTA